MLPGIDGAQQPPPEAPPAPTFDPLVDVISPPGPSTDGVASDAPPSPGSYARPLPDDTLEDGPLPADGPLASADVPPMPDPAATPSPPTPDLALGGADAFPTRIDVSLESVSGFCTA